MRQCISLWFLVILFVSLVTPSMVEKSAIMISYWLGCDAASSVFRVVAASSDGA